MKQVFAAISKFLHWLGRYAIGLSFCILVALDLMFRYFYRDCTGVSVTALQPLLFTVGWSLLLCGILYVLPTLGRRIGIVLVVTINALMCIVHGVMYNLFGNFFSFADLSYAGDGAAFFSFSYLRIRPGVLVCSLLAIAGAIVLAIMLPKKPYQKKKQPIAAAIMVVVALACIIVPHKQLMSQVKNYIVWDQRKGLDANIYKNQTNVNYAMGASGCYQYLFRSFAINSGLENWMEYGQMKEQLNEYYAQSEKNNHPSNEMSGKLAGKNVLFIMMESIDTWMLNEDYMPNLYALQQKSVNFANHYTPMYITAGTFNTEVIANTGMIPPTSGIDPESYMTNAFPTSLPHLFKQEGYTANSFHTSYGWVYNRGDIHRNWGYENYFDQTDMRMEHWKLDGEMLNAYDQMTANAPFFSFIITYSCHGPYTDEMHDISDGTIDQARELIAKRNPPLSGKNLEEYTYAVAQAMQTDVFFGGLLDKMEADGRLEDTVIVCFTDHFGKYMTDHEAVMKLKGVDNEDMLCQTPFFLYSADLPAQTVTKLTSSMDIAPTMANLFDLDVNYAYYVGNDIFGDYDDYIIFRGNNWYDGETYYSPAYSGPMTDEIKRRNQEVHTRMEYAWNTLRSDYFAK